MKSFKGGRWLVLAAVGIAGAGVWAGAGLAPADEPEIKAVFQCVDENPLDEHDATPAELEWRAHTTAQELTLDPVLRKAAGDLGLAKLAPRWSARFTRDGQLDAEGALKDLRERVRARVVPGTALIELSVAGPQDVEAAAIVRAVRENYLEMKVRFAQAVSLPAQEALSRTMVEVQALIDSEQAKRRTLVEENAAGCGASEAESLREVKKALLDVGSQRHEVGWELKRFEEQQLGQQNGVTYPAGMVEDVEAAPALRELAASRRGHQVALATLRYGGAAAEDPNVRAEQAAISATDDVMNGEKARLLSLRFDARLDELKSRENMLYTREKDLEEKVGALRMRLDDLARIDKQIADIDHNIGRLIDARLELQRRLEDLKMRSKMPSSIGVIDIGRERAPAL